jgi:mRNA interferase MazF
MTRIEPNQENGLSKVSAADSFQVRSVSKDRFVKQIGTIPYSIMSKIRIGLAKVLSIDSN